MLSWKEPLKAIRRSQPLNRLLTDAVRGACDRAGVHPPWLTDHLLRVGRASHQLRNGRELVLWAATDELVPNQVFWRGLGGYESETVTLFAELASRSRVVLDVGSHVGLFSLVAGHANPDAQVFAFEPVPAIFQRLQRNLALNDLPGVRGVCCAVGREYGTLELFVPADPEALPAASSLSRSQVTGTFGEVSSTLVPVVPLADFIAARGLEHLDLMKIDTETTEPDVLAGMGEALAKHRPHMVCEVLAGKGTGPGLEAHLGPLGYHYYLLGPHGPELRPRIEGDAYHLNYLLTTWSPAQVASLADASRRWA